jgi:hypothetical protein
VFTYFLFPIVSKWVSFVELNFMHDGTPTHFLSFLFVRGLTTILVVGGLGVEDQQNGPR